MEMKRCTAAILLMLSLEALVSAAAVADDGVDTIRLPSHGLADEIATAVAKETVGEKSVADGEEDPSPPWKCCDLSRCTRSMPPSCSCLDEVKCAKGCKNCEKAVRSNGASTRYICRDTYGKVAPPCTNMTVAADVRRVSTGNADAASEKTVAEGRICFG
ncbi:hypothetical protein ACQ4PT_033773 [Festuca glaucescens]